MIEVLSWWLTIQIMGSLFLPLAFLLFRNLKDRGYAFSKIMGLLIPAYILWVSATLGILPNERKSVLLILALLFLGALVLSWRMRVELWRFVQQGFPVIVATEAIFALAFLLWAAFRSYVPDIAGTEQPMDFAFLNAALRSPFFPPSDPWLSGNTVSYYYFGYLIMAVPAKILAMPSSISYNLSLALLFSLTVVGGFSLGYNLGGGQRRGIATGLLAGLFLVGVGNLEGVLEVIRSHNIGSVAFWRWIGIYGALQPYQSPTWQPTEFYWWWHATRVINTLRFAYDPVGNLLRVDNGLDYTITEFPFFSFMLGDMHPHVMALPFGLLALALSLQAIQSGDVLGKAWLMRNPLLAGVIALSLGSLGFINSWDFPTFTFVFLAAAGLNIYLGRKGLGINWMKDVVIFALIIGVGSVLLYLPFYLRFQSQASGILPWLGVGTRPVHFFIIWGLFLFLMGSLLAVKVGTVIRLGITGLSKATLICVAPVVLWAMALILIIKREAERAGMISRIEDKFWNLIPLWITLVFVLSLIIQKARQEKENKGGERSNWLFVLLLIFTGFLLVMGGELFYIRDVFGNRMNTMFKLYYQVWVLFAIASAYALYYGARSGWRLPWVKAIGGAGVLVFLAAALVYPVAAGYTRANGFSGRPTLDGLAFLKGFDLAEYEALQWLNTEVKGVPVIVEAVGSSYSEHGRVSGRTGLPTLLGWPGHEIQWRGSSKPLEGRERDVDQIYKSPDIDVVKSLLRKYNISYIYLGRLEKVKYGDQAGDRFKAFMDIAFKNAGVTIFKVRAANR